MDAVSVKDLKDAFNELLVACDGVLCVKNEIKFEHEFRLWVVPHYNPENEIEYRMRDKIISLTELFQQLNEKCQKTNMNKNASIEKRKITFKFVGKSGEVFNSSRFLVYSMRKLHEMKQVNNKNTPKKYENEFLEYYFPSRKSYIMDDVQSLPGFSIFNGKQRSAPQYDRKAFFGSTEVPPMLNNVSTNNNQLGMFNQDSRVVYNAHQPLQSQNMLNMGSYQNMEQNAQNYSDSTSVVSTNTTTQTTPQTGDYYSISKPNPTVVCHLNTFHVDIKATIKEQYIPPNNMLFVILNGRKFFNQNGPHRPGIFATVTTDPATLFRLFVTCPDLQESGMVDLQIGAQVNENQAVMSNVIKNAFIFLSSRFSLPGNINYPEDLHLKIVGLSQSSIPIKTTTYLQLDVLMHTSTSGNFPYIYPTATNFLVLFGKTPGRVLEVLVDQINTEVPGVISLTAVPPVENKGLKTELSVMLVMGFGKYDHYVQSENVAFEYVEEGEVDPPDDKTQLRVDDYCKALDSLDLSAGRFDYFTNWGRLCFVITERKDGDNSSTKEIDGGGGYGIKAGPGEEHGHLVPMMESFIGIFDQYGFGLLIHFAARGLTFLLKRLLEFPQVDINYCDVYGNTALHWAFLFGHEECKHVLIQLGANVNLVNNYGKTPLQIREPVERLNINPNLQVFYNHLFQRERRGGDDGNMTTMVGNSGEEGGVGEINNNNQLMLAIPAEDQLGLIPLDKYFNEKSFGLEMDEEMGDLNLAPINQFPVVNANPVEAFGMELDDIDGEGLGADLNEFMLNPEDYVSPLKREVEKDTQEIKKEQMKKKKKKKKKKDDDDDDEPKCPMPIPLMYLPSMKDVEARAALVSQQQQNYQQQQQTLSQRFRVPPPRGNSNGGGFGSKVMLNPPRLSNSIPYSGLNFQSMFSDWNDSSGGGGGGKDPPPSLYGINNATHLHHFPHFDLPQHKDGGKKKKKKKKKRKKLKVNTDSFTVQSVVLTQEDYRVVRQTQNIALYPPHFSSRRSRKNNNCPLHEIGRLDPLSEGVGPVEKFGNAPYYKYTMQIRFNPILPSMNTFNDPAVERDLQSLRLYICQLPISGGGGGGGGEEEEPPSQYLPDEFREKREARNPSKYKSLAYQIRESHEVGEKICNSHAYLYGFAIPKNIVSRLRGRAWKKPKYFVFRLVLHGKLVYQSEKVLVVTKLSENGKGKKKKAFVLTSNEIGRIESQLKGMKNMIPHTSEEIIFKEMIVGEDCFSVEIFVPLIEFPVPTTATRRRAHVLAFQRFIETVFYGVKSTSGTRKDAVVYFEPDFKIVFRCSKEHFTKEIVNKFRGIGWNCGEVIKLKVTRKRTKRNKMREGVNKRRKLNDIEPPDEDNHDKDFVLGEGQ